jgi:hypothetical protein
MDINPVDWVLTKNNSFDPKWHETHFLSRSTWLNPYWPGRLGFDRKWRFWPETAWKLVFYPCRHGLTRIDLMESVLTQNGLKTHFLPCSTWFDPYWPGGIGFDQKWRFWPVTAWKLIFYPGQYGLTYIDPMESVFMERCGWLKKNIFLTFKLFLNFFGFLKIIIEIK